MVHEHPVRSQARIGLFTTLPILWNEAPDVASLLNDSDEQHWARAILVGHGALIPLDTLSAPGGNGPLDQLDWLVLAQPRPLGPQENVALDDWVRGGGRLLLFADPALTEQSAFPIGDPRRPQAVVLLSPILKRWGLELRFDEAQPFGDRPGMVMGESVPVNLPGHFIAQGHPKCRLLGGGLAADCSIGKGRVVALADAAVLERDDLDGARGRAFAGLLDAAFAPR